MVRKINAIIIIVLFTMASIGVVIASDKGNARKGKFLYRKNCRTCHQEGGSAKELSPVSKTQAEWDEVFKGYENLACQAEWQKLSDKDRVDMYAHLWGHAFDSPSPAKCK